MAVSISSQYAVWYNGLMKFIRDLVQLDEQTARHKINLIQTTVAPNVARKPTDGNIVPLPNLIVQLPGCSETEVNRVNEE